MATPKQRAAARRNIKKAQAAWRGMTTRQRTLAQPQGRARKKPGTTGKGHFYRIMVRPKSEFVTFRVQDVGEKGGLERVAGKTLRLMSELATQAEPIDDTLRDMQAEILRMDHLTKMLLDVSQFDAGRVRLDRKLFDLAEVVANAAGARHAHQGTVAFRKEHPILVQGDPGRIGQVLTNLIENALKYSDSREPILVSVRKNGNRVITSVSDKGRGIPKEELPKLFDPFFRTQAAAQSSVTGAGLGLYIVKEIVRAHRGRVWVESEEGIGTTFSFSLPVGGGKQKAPR
jgi:signal transduction histidine kinase